MKGIHTARSYMRPITLDAFPNGRPLTLGLNEQELADLFEATGGVYVFVELYGSCMGW